MSERIDANLNETPHNPSDTKPLIEGARNWVTYGDMHGNDVLLTYRLVTDGIISDKSLQSTDAPILQNLLAQALITEADLLSTAPELPVDDAVTPAEPAHPTVYQVFKKLSEQHAQLMEAYYRTRGRKAEPTPLDRAAFDTLKESIRKNYLAVKALIDTFEVADTTTAVRLIGDLMGDRGPNDIFTALILKKLKEAGVNYEILFSNHDATCVDSLLRPEGPCLPFDKNQTARDNLAPPTSTTKTQARSLWHAQALMEIEGTISRDEQKALFAEVYSPHLKLIAYAVVDGKVQINTHAPIDFEIIKDLARSWQIDVTHNFATAADFFRTADAINAQFSERLASGALLHQINAEDELISKISGSGYTFYSDKNPLHAFIWNRMQEVSNDPYSTTINAERVRYALIPPPANTWMSAATFNHGHVGDACVASNYYNNLDSRLGKPDYNQGELLTLRTVEPQDPIAAPLIAPPSRTDEEESVTRLDDLLESAYKTTNTKTLDTILKKIAHRLKISDPIQRLTALKKFQMRLNYSDMASDTGLLRQKTALLIQLQTYICHRLSGKTSGELITQRGFFKPNRNEKMTTQKVIIAEDLKREIAEATRETALQGAINDAKEAHKELIAWTVYGSGDLGKCLNACEQWLNPSETTTAAPGKTR